MDSLSVSSQTPSSQLSPDEEKLLAKLEEQNRLLETDSKSLYSVSCALHSPCSPKVFSFEESSSRIWSCVVKNWDEWSKRKVKQLKMMVRRGIHPHFRATVWQLLCNAQKSQETYTALLQNTSTCEQHIRKDLSQIAPRYDLFQDQGSSNQEQLFNVLKAYSVLDPEVGYNQANAFIVQLLLTQMAEQEAFCVFVRLMQDFRLRELYRPQMVELSCCVFQLQGLIQEHLPELHSHFYTHAFHTSTFSSSWFLTIFLSCLPLNAAIRVFDIFLCEGLETVFRVGLAVLQLTQAELMKLDLEAMTQFLKKSAPKQMEKDPDMMINVAYQIKIDTKKMKKLEREYTAMKLKEMEEQEEIRRFQSENKHLRKKADVLEKRCCEDLVWQLGQAVSRSRLKEGENQHILKQLEIKILLLEKCGTVPDESRTMHLQDELANRRLREAEALSELGQLEYRIRDLEENFKTEKQDRRSTQDELQVELISFRLREAQTQAQLQLNKLKLLELQVKNQICANRLQWVMERVRVQRDRLQELTVQNCGLGRLLLLEEDGRKNLEDEHDDEGKVITELHEQIADLQAQIQRLSENPRTSAIATLQS